MKPKIKYIELKTGFSDNGPAWIGLVSFSKSGRTIYFNGKALQSMQGTGINSNYFDLESGEEYWVSGVKKDMTDRHWAGGGTIMVEKRILSDYLNLVGRKELPGSGYELTEVQTEKPIEKIYELENNAVKPDKFDPGLRYKAPGELTIEELKFVISALIRHEENATFNKGRRAARRKRILLEEELEKRVKNAAQ